MSRQPTELSTWWVPGLALHERPAAKALEASGADDRARSRLESWRAAYDLGATGRFDLRLADVGLDEPALLEMLAEPPAALALRAVRPDWAETVERVLDLNSGPWPESGEGPASGEGPERGEGQEPGDDSWLEMFAALMSPFVVDARSQLVSLAGRLPVGQHVDLDLVAEEFGDQLGRRLARLAARTLVLELNLARTAGRLSGADGRARFVDFVLRTGRPASLASLFETYPVLARLLAEASRYAVEAHLELLSRFLADREEVVALLLDGVDPGPVVGVAAGQGDLHRRGRSVAILSFAGEQRTDEPRTDEQKLVYKPRSLAAHLQFTGFVEWLNEAVPGLRLKAARAVARADYGWSEFIAHRPLADLSGADRFYRRQGALLALLHVVHASDVHCENVIACGDLPVLVDTETLFHPTLAAPASGQDPAARTLAASVYRTGLLPKLVVGANGALDVSGLGGDHGQLSPNDAVDWEFPGTDQMRLTRRPATFVGACNRPRLGDRVIDPGDHEGALIEGFRLGYAAIMRGRREFTELVNRCAGTEVRVVIRPTRLYATLLDESTHPDLLRDALERDQVLDLLWADGSHPLPSHRLVRHELADLWAGDVPFFATRPEARDVWTSDGQRLPDVFDGAGLSRALDKLGAMSEADRRDQEWIISASLATRRPVDGHRSVDPAPGPVIGAAAEPSRLLAAACAVADQIVARGVTSQDRVNWLGLELVDDTHWLILPLGAGLANGYVGVALFLAQLADLTGVSRYADVARRAVSAVPQMCQALAGQPELVAAVGCGGYYGFGGIGYALARLGTLLSDEDIQGWARAVVELAATAAASTAAGSDVATGTAGCLAAMTAVHEELGLDGAAEVARRCADRLAGMVESTDNGGMPGGFTNGAAGIGWALSRFGAAGGGSRYVQAGLAAISAATRATATHRAAMPTDGWCGGTAGVVAARAGVGSDDGDLEWAVKSLASRPVQGDLSLCHGELGIAEALNVLAARQSGGSAARARRRRAGLVLDAIGRYGVSCGTPGGVVTPGLMSGLAGIGYGLLRLGFSDRVPSVLLLEATPAGPTIDKQQTKQKEN